MTDPIIDAQGLTKRFPDQPKQNSKKKTVHAVTDLTFAVADGS